MTQFSLEQLQDLLNSQLTRERVLALLEVQKETTPIAMALTLIDQALTDENSQVKGMAVFALGIKQSPGNCDRLVQILTTDSDYNIRAMAAGALGYLEDNRALYPLRRAFYEDSSWLVQFSAAVALGNLKDPQAKGVLLEALASETTLLQQAAIMALGEIQAIDSVEQLAQFAVADDWITRQRLAGALGNLPCPKSVSVLKFLEKDSIPQVAEAATYALKQLDE